MIDYKMKYTVKPLKWTGDAVMRAVSIHDKFVIDRLGSGYGLTIIPPEGAIHRMHWLDKELDQALAWCEARHDADVLRYLHVIDEHNALTIKPIEWYVDDSKHTGETPYYTFEIEPIDGQWYVSIVTIRCDRDSEWMDSLGDAKELCEIINAEIVTPFLKEVKG